MSFASGVRSVLGLRDVRLLLAAGLVSQTGDWALRTGIGFQIYVLTGSTLAAATVLLVSLAPQVLLGSIAGAYVDRSDRRRVMIIVNLLLAVVLAPLLMVGDQAWLIYLVLAVSSCLSPFFLAAEATMVPEMITDPSLRITANAINSQVRDVSRLVGAALGGVLAATGGIPALALGDVISFIVAAAAIALIRHRPPLHDDAPAGRIRGELAEGFAVIRCSRPLAVILIFMIVTGIGEAIMGTLFAPFVHDLLHGGAADFGRIVAAQAIGGILGGVLISLVGHRRSPAALFGWGAVLFGLLDLALFCYPLVAGERPPIWPAMVIIALVGLPGAALVRRNDHDPAGRHH